MASESAPFDSPPPGDGAGEHTTPIRVRYPETDPQGVVHHAVYLHYFEVGRTELLRTAGVPYSDVERTGARLMVTECQIEYRHPAYYDDILLVRTRVERVSKVRIFLSYEVTREESADVVCTGSTTLASVGEDGRPSTLPGRLARVLGSGGR